MKKIKTQLKTVPLKSTPRVALLILAEQRYKMLTLMLDWYQGLVAELAGEVELSVHVASVADAELKELLSRYPEVNQVTTTAGSPLGERNNEALQSLQASEVDAVLIAQPGDLLTASLIRAHGAHLKDGGLFTGLLDAYLYDPTEFKFMYWAQHRFESHSSRVAPIGYALARPLLDALKWRLWPNQVKPADGFHGSILDRLSQAFKRAPQGSCVSQTMEMLKGGAISLKSELARALYEEGNWQKLQGLSYRSLETELEGQVSEGWFERLNSFDERIKLELLLEEPPEGAPSVWQTHYDFSVYKFLPFADVRLRLLSATEKDTTPHGWNRVICEGATQAERYQSALSQLRDQGGDLFLFAGRGGLIDLKTMEHYLIHATRSGARLLAALNFFIADLETNQLYFWPGMTSGHFTEQLGFGACVHRTYLDQLNWSLLSEGGVTAEAKETLTRLATSEEARNQTVFFKCATHKLGLIAMGFEGLLGFEDKVRLSDLKRVSLGQLPAESYQVDAQSKLQAWIQGVSPSVSQPSAPQINPPQPSASHPSEPNMSSMSPLERAKALLSQANSNTVTAETATQSSAPELSPLERAKALLAKGQEVAQVVTSTPQTSEQQSPTLSPLEKAKALLAKNRASTADDTASSAPATERPVEQEGMSPLERAKALLAQAERSPQQTSEGSEAQPEASTAKSVIDDAIQSAEQVVAQLTAQRDAALKAVQEATARQGREENPAAALLCEQGEVAFGEGELEKAAQLFESALVVDVDSIRALSNLGVVAMQVERPWQALSYLLVALIKDHEDENVVANLHGLLSAYPELKVAQSLFG